MSHGLFMTVDFVIHCHKCYRGIIKPVALSCTLGLPVQISGGPTHVAVAAGHDAGTGKVEEGLIL